MIGHLIRRLLRDRRGLSAVEGAMVAPVILMTIAVGYDLTSYVTTQSRVREVAFRLADYAAADAGLGVTGRLSSVAAVRGAAADMMTPLKTCEVAGIVLSGVTNPSGKGAVITWQEKWHYPTVPGSADCPGVASTTMTSGLGAIGAAPKFSDVLPNQSIKTMTVKPRDSVIVAEIVFRDVRSVLPMVFDAVLPTTQIGAGAARVRSQIP
jgi:Flp pilus assembly protein TadG